jgi:cytochrome c oxidase subunit 4
MSHVSPKSTYYAIFGALMVLTAITVAAAFIDLGVLNFPVALAIAITKATLVVLFFMHVKYNSRLVQLVCGGAFFFLVVLFGLTMSDYLSRGWFASPRGTVGAGTQVTIGPPQERVEEPGEQAPGAAPVAIPEGREPVTPPPSEP